MVGRRVKLAIAVSACFFLAVPAGTSAEPYLAGFVGAAFTQQKDLDTKLDLNGLTLVDGTFKNLDFDTPVVFGGKVGYFFDHAVLGGNLGLELEAYHFEPDVSEQTVKFSGTGLPSEFRIQKANIEVTTIGLNLLYRYPLAQSADFPHGRLQPYAGVGLGIFIANLETTTSVLDVNKKIDDTDTQPGVQLLAGARFFLTSHIALFAEYKFMQTPQFTFDFKASGTFLGFPATETARDKADLTEHQLIMGIGFHW